MDINPEDYKATTFKVDHEEETTDLSKITQFPSGHNFNQRLQNFRMRVCQLTEIPKAPLPIDPLTGEILPVGGPKYAIHPTCNHLMDGEIKYTRTSLQVPEHDPITGHARYTRLDPCPHCTPEIRKEMETNKAKKNMEKYYAGSGLPAYAAKWHYGNIPDEMDCDSVDMVKDAVEQSIASMNEGKAGQSLFLSGVPGCGKTSMATSSMLKFMEAGYASFCVLMPEYFNKVYRAMHKDAAPELTHLEETLEVVPVALLDDFGAENPTPDVLKRIFLLIEGRTSKGLLTIITSNNSLEALQKLWHKPELDPEIQQMSGRIIRRIKTRFKVISVEPWGENPR